MKWQVSPKSAAALIVGLLLLPLAGWLVVWVARGWIPQGDEGWIALRTRDVFSAHPPLQGMRSTSALSAPGVWAHHPGPVEFYLLAVPYAVSGFHPIGLLVGCFLLGAGFIATALWHARAAGGVRGVVLVVSAIAVSEAMFGPLLVLPWNPWPAVFGLVALLAVVWRLILGHECALPWAVGVGSIVAQTNLSMAPVLAPMLLVLAAMGLTRWRRSRGSVWPLPGWRSATSVTRWRSPGCWALVVLAVAWLPAVIELFAVWPNNASQVWQLGMAALHGPAQAFAAVVLVGVCGGGGWRLGSAGIPSSREGVRVVSVLIIVGLVVAGVASDGTRLLYLIVGLGGLVFAIGAWGDRLLYVTGRRMRQGMAVAGGLTAMVAIGVLAPGGAWASGLTRGELDSARESAPVVREALLDLRSRGIDSGPVAIHASGPRSWGAYESAIAAGLAAKGYRPYFDTGWPRPEGDAYRRLARTPASATRLTVDDDDCQVAAAGPCPVISIG